MRAGRVETYMHSDSTTQNKGGAIVLVETDTDFGARTPAFIAFTKQVARLAYATPQEPLWDAVHYDDIVKVFPGVEEDRKALEIELKEKVRVYKIEVFRL
jgi:translation elongation factor EF-Ts